MTFEVWVRELIAEMQRRYDMTESEAVQYVGTTGEECWRESWADGLSPSDALDEEDYCAAQC